MRSAVARNGPVGRLEAALRASEGRRVDAERRIEQMVALLEAAPVLLFALDAHGTIVMAEGGRLAPAGFRAADLRGRSAIDVMGGSPEAVERLGRVYAGSDEEGTLRVGARTFSVRLRAIRDGERVTGVSGAAVDITERLRDAERLAQAALRDQLTGLPNRVLLRDRIRQAIPAAMRVGHRTAIAVIDLDAFHEVNDALGRETGDAVLRQVAARFRDAVPEPITVARLDGDRFGVLAPDVVDARAAARILQYVRDSLATPIRVSGNELSLDASCGIAVAPDHGDDPDTLVQSAERALARAALTGGCAVHMPEEGRGAAPLPADLRRGIAAGELALSFRPTFEIAGGRLVGAEGLVRWKHPRRGLLAAARFIAVAEQSGLVGEITSWALREAARVSAAWRAAGLDLVVTVTVAARDLADGRLPMMVRAATEASRVPADRLVLQVPRVSVERSDQVDALRELSATGVRIAVDRIAAEAPAATAHVQVVRIDRTSLASLVSDAGQATLLRSAVAAAHAAGMTVVAAGVESADVLRRLAEIGCDLAQGDFLAPAFTAEDFVSWARGQEGETPRLGPDALSPGGSPNGPSGSAARWGAVRPL